MSEALRPPTTWRAALLVLVLAALVYAAAGNQGKLFHDDALFLYGGQEMVRGVPVYVGLFDHKGPLGQMVCGLGVALARLSGADDVATTRHLFLLISSATAAGVFLLAGALFRRRLHAWIAAAAFVSFWGHGGLAWSGTRPKALMLLFETLTMLAVTRRAWFLAGLAGSLAAFTWQPAGVFLVGAFLVAALGGEPGARARAALRVVAGSLVPALLLGLYAVGTGSVGPFLDGCFLFNLRYLDNPASFAEQFDNAMRIVLFGGMGVLTVLGLGTVLLLYAWRWRASRDASGPRWRALLGDPFAILLITFPLPVLWSVRDFQQYPDFYVFLPYVALGLAWALASSIEGIADAIRPEGRARAVLLSLPAAFLFLFSAEAYHFAQKVKLPPQRERAREFAETYGDARLVAIGAPDLLVLLGRRTPTPYSFVMRGLREYIDDTHEGGFAGWLAALDATEPEVLVVDDDYPRRLGPYAETWLEWLATYERRPSIGEWSIYVPRGADPR